jgi:serine/threonine protein kinase/protocatechuate 3,4-dioxygenase beta subunit
MTDSEPRSDLLPSATKGHAKCEKCGATMRLDTGVCVSCLLREGLEGGDEVSQACYQSVLAEVDAPHKSWFLGNYEILEQIGCGGMGVIYRARQRHSRRIVAVKRVLSYRADSHEALERFRREAQAVASLDHPNILPIYEVSESEDGLPFFSMKFAENGSLQENAPSLRNAPRTCVQLMAKVARAVEYAHSRGVLHRDIKPGNILLNDRSEPLVSDFGLAKLLDGNNDLTRSLTTFGTAGFIAPEQAGHAAVDFTPVADVYSLGAVLFNVLAGRPPFLGPNPVSVIRQASETQAPKLRSLAPSLDRDLETICARCLERDPKARYQSAGDLAADLERWLEGRPIVARPVSPPARIWRWSQRNPKLVGAAVTGLLLGAATVWPFRGELFRPSQFNPPDRRSGVGFSVPVQNQFNPFTVPDYTSPGDFVPRRPDTRVAGAPPETGFITGAPDRALEAGLRTNKITADMIAAPPETAFNTSARDRALEASLRTNKITAEVTAAPPETGFNTSVRDRASEASLRTNKIAADGPASIQGFVKDAKGEPIKGADVRIESRDGKQLLSTAKTDSKGRYISQRLQPGGYRVTLLVNGAVKASIMNTQTNANQPTQLNFDFKPKSQADNIAKGGKHMVWVPNRTGSHLGGNWVEVDEKANEHSRSNVETYSVRR